MEAIYIFDHSIFSGMVQTSENTRSSHILTKNDQIVQENDEPEISQILNKWNMLLARQHFQPY